MRETLARVRESLTIDQKINGLLLAVGFVTAATLILAALIYPQVSSSSAGIDAVNEASDMDACRASYRAEIDQAEVRLSIAQAHSDQLIRRAIGAVIVRDRELLEDLGEQAVEVDQQVSDAITYVAEANRSYRTAVTLSREDPEAFLSECQENP